MNNFPAALPQSPHVPVTTVDLPAFKKAGVHLDLLRLDLVHPLISGNKWFKSKYALEAVPVLMRRSPQWPLTNAEFMACNSILQ